MSYEVLARKYRPQRFEEVLGQRHVTQTLQNALEQKRIHHAYLFTGARGIGKTTVARILAKALNCEPGISREPCNQCGLCQEIITGKSIDVQEIDGASNTGVDDVRQIREQTQYLPARGRYKVYIIDEVHMLSTQAFNALLKTLEEPPKHVVFIFATTEAHKIPVTILSRCQRYDFRRIPTKELVASLAKIAQVEKIDYAPEVLPLLAHEAQGSLRDAQSLFDQAIAFAGSKITYSDLQAMLGFLDRNQFWALLEAVVKKDKEGALAALDRFYQAGADLNRLVQDLLGQIRHLFLLKSLQAVPDWFDLPKEEVEHLQALSSQLTLDECDQLFQLVYRGVEEIARSPHPKMVLEVLLVRMTLVNAVIPLSQILAKLEQLAPGSAKVPVNQIQPPTKGWEAFVDWLERQKPQLASIIGHGKLVRLEAASVELGFVKDSLYGEMLKEEERQRQLVESMTQFFGHPMALHTTLLPEPKSVESSSPQQKAKDIRRSALTHESVKEAANILGAVVEEVRTKT